jgi:hypothetical protein
MLLEEEVDVADCAPTIRRYAESPLVAPIGSLLGARRWSSVPY